MKNERKVTNDSGITLIALVITIIVLLILAGISIAMLAGDNGVLTKASDSKIVNAIGAKKDEVALVAAEAMSDYYDEIYLTNNSSEYKNSGLVEKISNALKGDKLSKDEPDITVEVTEAVLNGDNVTTYPKVKISGKAKTDLYTEGEIQEKGSVKWTDNFKHNNE